MGTLLKRKFDFTSVEGVQYAFKAIFKKPSPPEEIFQSSALWLLEATRNVVVHNASIVDEQFTEATKNMKLGYVEGQPLPLDSKLVSRLANASIDSGCKLLEFVDNWLVKNPE